MTEDNEKGDGWIIIHEGTELGDGCHRVLARRRGGGERWDLGTGSRAEHRPGAEPGQRLVALLRDAVGPVLPETVSGHGKGWSPRHAVCARRLPFYNPPEGDAWLFEVFDCGAHARYRFVAPVRMNGDGARVTDRPAVLDWSATPLHQLDVRFRLSLATDSEPETKQRVWSYAEFFSGSVAGEEGTFILLDDSHEVLRAEDAWRVKSQVVYSGEVLHAVLAVGQDGGVEMVENEVLRDRPPEFALALQAFERKVAEVAWRPAPAPPAAVPGPAAHIWWPLHAGSGFPAGALKLLVADPESAGPLAVDSLERLQDFDEDLMQILQSDETAVRCRSLKCHESDLWQAFLCEMFRPRGDSGGAEAEAEGGNGPAPLLAGYERARCIVLKEKDGNRAELLPLDWKSPGIYRLNDLLGFPAAGPQSAARIADYLQYFCSSLQGTPGTYANGIPTFTILEPVPADRVTWNGADGRWHVKGIEVVYGEQVFAADFSIDKEGVVEMVADSPREGDLPAEGAVLRGCGLFALTTGSLPPYHVDTDAFKSLLARLAEGRPDAAVKTGGQLLEWGGLAGGVRPLTGALRELRVIGAGVKIEEGSRALGLSCLLVQSRETGWFSSVRLNGWLAMSGIDCAGSLALYSLHVGGQIDLRGARVRGNLDLDDVTLDVPKGGKRHESGRIPLGTLDLKDATVEGAVLARNVRGRRGSATPLVFHHLDAKDGMEISRLEAPGLDLRYLRTRSGGVQLRDLQLEAKGLTGWGAVIKGNLDIHGAAAEGSVALEHVEVSGRTWVDGVQAAALDLSGSRIGGRCLVCCSRNDQGELVNPHANRFHKGVNMDRMEAAVLTMSDTEIGGDLRLHDSRITGSIFMRPDRPGEKPVSIRGSLILSGIEVGGQIECEGIRVGGGIDMISPRPVRALYLRRARPVNQEGDPEGGQGCQEPTDCDILGPVIIVGLEVGTVDLKGTRLASLDFRDCRISNCLNLSGVTVGAEELGDIRMNGTPVGNLICWPLRDDEPSLRCRRLNLNQVHFSGGVEITGARIGRCVQEGSGMSESGRTEHTEGLFGDFIRCGADFTLNNSRFRNLSLRHARISGNVELHGSGPSEPDEDKDRSRELWEGLGFSEYGPDPFRWDDDLPDSNRYGIPDSFKAEEVVLDHMDVDGDLRLAGVEVHRHLSLKGGRVGGNVTIGGEGKRTAIGGNLDLEGRQIEGGVVVGSCRVGNGDETAGQVILNGARMDELRLGEPEGDGRCQCRCLQMKMATVKGDVDLRGLEILPGTASGGAGGEQEWAVRARGLTVSGRLQLCDRAQEINLKDSLKPDGHDGEKKKDAPCCANLNGSGMDLSSADIDHLVVSRECFGKGSEPQRSTGDPRPHWWMLGAGSLGLAAIALPVLIVVAGWDDANAPGLWRGTALVVLALICVFLAWHFAGLAVEMKRRFRSRYDDADRGLPLLPSLLDGGSAGRKSEGDRAGGESAGGSTSEKSERAGRKGESGKSAAKAGSALARVRQWGWVFLILALAAFIGVGGVIGEWLAGNGKGWLTPRLLGGDGVVQSRFWLLGVFAVAGYLVYRLFDICSINALSAARLGAGSREGGEAGAGAGPEQPAGAAGGGSEAGGDQTAANDDLKRAEVRGRLRAIQLGFRDLLQCLGAVALPREDNEKDRAPTVKPVRIVVERAQIGHWELHEPFPDQIDLSNVRVERWSVGGAEPGPRFLRILELATEFKRSTYAHVEQALRNQGHREMADRVHRAMRRQEQWREKRRFVKALMFLHSLIGYGTRRASALGFMLVWYLFTAVWIAAEHPQVVELSAATRIGLHEITSGTPGVAEFARWLDPACDGANDADDCRWRDGPAGAGQDAGNREKVQARPGGATDTRDVWVRIGHGLALALRYHVPIITWDPWPYLQPRGAMMWTYTSVVEAIHWVLWPLLLASLLQALLPRRED